MMLLHHETIIPAISQGASATWFWSMIAMAYLAAVLHKLKHAWIRMRYGAKFDAHYTPAEDCEVCGRKDSLKLTAHRVDNLYQESWLCADCKHAVAEFEVTR